MGWQELLLLKIDRDAVSVKNRLQEAMQLRWSKLKQQLEVRFAPALQGRLSVELTKYSKPTRSENGEFFVLLDNKKIFSASEYAAYRDSAGQYYRQPEDFDAHGITTEFKAYDDLHQSLSWSIDEFASKPNPLLRGLATADSRFGRRRLAEVRIDEENPFVVEIVNARLAKATSPAVLPGR